MFNWFRRSALPPLMQPAVGSKADREWAAAPEPGILETLFGWGSDGKRYELPPADMKRLRPLLLPDPRAERNRAIAAERARRRARDRTDPGPISFAVDAPQQAPGAVPMPYADLDAAFPDATPEAKSFMGGRGRAVVREWGPRHHD